VCGGLSDGVGGGDGISSAARFYPSSGGGCVMALNLRRKTTYGDEDGDDVEVVQHHLDPFNVHKHIHMHEFVDVVLHNNSNNKQQQQH